MKRSRIDSNNARRGSHRRRRGFTAIDMIAAIVIFVGAVVLTAQIMVAMAAHLRAKRIDFIARQTTENVMEVSSAIPYDQLEQLNQNRMPELLQLLHDSAAPGSPWKISTSVQATSIDGIDDARRIDVVVTHEKRNREARLSTWRFRTEATDATE